MTQARERMTPARVRMTPARVRMTPARERMTPTHPDGTHEPPRTGQNAPMPLLTAVIALGLAAASGFVGYVLGLRAGETSAPAALPDGDAEEFVQHLREVAWQHRDVSPELSTILLDEIAQRHRRELG